MTTWINPNDKTQAQYLPNIGEPCLFAPLSAHQCDCAHLSQIIAWKRGDKAQIKQRHDRCIHPEGPHQQNEFCQWRTPKTEGAME